MSSTSLSLTILSEEQKFNGDNLLSWTTNMTQLLGAKGLSGYIDGKIPLPIQTTSGTSTTHPTPIYSTTPTADEWHFRDQLTRGHITLNCTDVAGLGVKTTGTAKEAWDSIRSEWGTSTDMRRSHAQELLNKTIYAEGASIQDHIKLLRTRKAAIDNLSATAMNDETWRGIIIRSIPPTARWLPVIPSLYTLTSSADIVSILLAHSMILNRGNENEPTSSSSNTALTARGEDGCANPNCKAKIRSTHTTANCYWPGGGKEGQFPPNFGQRSKATSAILSSHETTQHFALSAWISKQRRTSYTVSEILIEDPDERSDHVSSTMGDHIPLFDTLFDTLDSIHTIDDNSDDAAPDIRGPLTPDFTPTSIKTPTGTSTDVSGEENLQDIEVEACNGNVLVEGKRVKLDQTDDDNQPISRLDEPRPGPDSIDRPTTLHAPHTEEDSTEVEIHKPTDGNDPILTKNDTHLTDSVIEEGASHKTAVTPGTNEIPNEMLLLAEAKEQGKNRATKDAKGDPKFPVEKPEGRRKVNPDTVERHKVNPETVERRKVNSEEGRHEVCPSTADDTKSILDDAESIRRSYTIQIDAQSNVESISTPMDLENPLLKSQHLPTIVNMTNIRYQEGIGFLTIAPKSYAGEDKGGDESGDSEEGEGVDEDNEDNWVTMNATNEAQGRRKFDPETAERRKANPEKEDDAKSNPKGRDDAKSNPKEVDDAKSNALPRPDFDDAETILMPMDHNTTLLKGQHPPSIGKIAKLKDLPYREATEHPIYSPIGTNSKTPTTIAIIDEILEEPPQISSDQSRGGGGASWINPRKHREGPIAITTHFSDNPRIVSTDVAFTIAIDTMTAEIFTKNLEDPGGMHSNVTKHVFRDLEGMGGINSVRDDKRNDSPVFGDVGEEPQHGKGNHTPKDGRTVPWINPREQDFSTRSTTTEEVSTVGRRTWPCGPLDPFGKYSHRYPGSTNELIASYITERGGETGNNL